MLSPVTPYSKSAFILCVHCLCLDDYDYGRSCLMKGFFGMFYVNSVIQLSLSFPVHSICLTPLLLSTHLLWLCRGNQGAGGIGRWGL